jgi:glycosyltransferase involved in cell wall biosynthesis
MSNFLIVTESVPNIYHGGGGVTAYAVIMSLKKQAHKVTVLSLSPSTAIHNERTDTDYIRALNLHDVQVEILAYKKQSDKTSQYRKLFPRMSDVFTGFDKNKEVEKVVRRIKPDAIFAYHWDPIASVISVTDIPKLGIVGDPVHLPYLFRKEYYSRVLGSKLDIPYIKHWILEKTQISRKIKFMDQLLLSCDVSGAFAAHHAQDFITRNVSNCEYFRTPVPDPFENNTIGNKAGKCKILHIGHLQGIATLTGVELLAKEILPELDRLIGKENYEVHLVGGYFDTIAAPIKLLLDHPSVKVRGQISPSDEEFLSSHILLVPTPIELGIRVRIITGFSFGSCIIAHKANSKGIPELVNGENCFMGSDGKSLARACAEVYQDDTLRKKLEMTSRETYDKYFSLSAAGKEISDTLIGLSHSNKV